MPGGFELKPLFAKIWHAPEQFHLMDPLPPMHRRGLILAALLVIIGFMLPTTDDTVPTSGESNTQTAFPSLPKSLPTEPGQTSGPVITVPQQSAPVTAPQTATQNTAPLPTTEGIEQQWRSYRVEEGKTLAQLFRDNNLPTTDVYAMAKSEGDDKPLSSLQSGQIVKIRQNANGIVTGLNIETDGQQVLFTRQPDGSFIRAR